MFEEVPVVGPSMRGLKGGYRLLSALTELPFESHSVETGTPPGVENKALLGGLMGQPVLEDFRHLRIERLEGPLRDGLT